MAGRLGLELPCFLTVTPFPTPREMSGRRTEESSGSPGVVERPQREPLEPREGEFS